MTTERRIDPTFAVNEDGTFVVECWGVHYGSASIGDVVGWLVEQLIEMRAAAQSSREGE